MASRPVPDAMRIQPQRLAAALRHASEAELRGPRYSTLTTGVRWPSDEPVTHGRMIQAFREVLPEDAVLGGLSAAWAWGCRHADLADDVLVLLDDAARVRQRRGLQVRSWRLGRHHVARTPLGRATTPVRTLAVLLCTMPRLPAVVAADAVLHVTGTAVALVARSLESMPGRRGIAGARARVHLLEPASESPRETRLRIVLVDAGLPRPTAQYEVRDAAGQFVGRLDLAWPHLRVGVEYDGGHHQASPQHSRDLARHNRLRAAGWVVVQVDARALGRPDELVAQVAAVIASRA